MAMLEKKNVLYDTILKTVSTVFEKTLQIENY